ncbi:hypothetical protein M885DRAFT_525611 [Pelagophyceae sp. CCMP2097]|nr:hypothetical protein M885DRAFT_525611 [Pelagophyceae sp. CCMP2097]
MAPDDSGPPEAYVCKKCNQAGLGMCHCTKCKPKSPRKKAKVVETEAAQQAAPRPAAAPRRSKDDGPPRAQRPPASAALGARARGAQARMRPHGDGLPPVSLEDAARDVSGNEAFDAGALPHPPAAPPPAPPPSPSVRSLAWATGAPVPVDVERALLSVVLRWPNERGMMRNQPAWRVAQVRAACGRGGVALAAALSLRRLHIKWRNQAQSHAQLQLGTEDHVRAAAEAFELATADFLDAARVAYRSEDAQKEATPPHLRNKLPTPDFLLVHPVLVNGTLIHWIDAKHFYAASTIPRDRGTICASLVRTASKYNAAFGAGAFVFSYGCGADLAAALEEFSVLCLDGSSVGMARVFLQQRTWCANAAGEILP